MPLCLFLSSTPRGLSSTISLLAEEYWLGTFEAQSFPIDHAFRLWSRIREGWGALALRSGPGRFPGREGLDIRPMLSEGVLDAAATPPHKDAPSLAILPEVLAYPLASDPFGLHAGSANSISTQSQLACQTLRWVSSGGMGS